MTLAALNKYKELLTSVSVFLGVGILLYLFLTLPFQDVWEQFLGVHVSLIAQYAAAIIFIQLVLTWRWHAVLQSREYDVDFWSLNNYRLAGAAVSFLTPTAKMGGEPVRAIMLSDKESMAFDDSLSTVVIDKTIELTSSGLFFIIGLLAALITYSVSASLRNTLIGVIVFLTVLISGFFIRVFNGKTFFAWLCTTLRLDSFEWFEGPLERLYEFERLVVDFYEDDTKGLVYAVLISLMSWIGMFFEYYFVGLIVGVELTALQVFFVFTFVGLAYIVPVPMAVGTLEAGQVGLFSVIGLGSAIGLGVSLVVRAKDMMVSAYGLVYLFFSGMSVQRAFEEADVVTDEVDELDDV
jgi:uncharacterized protein (TIRG00374 family)